MILYNRNLYNIINKGKKVYFYTKYLNISSTKHIFPCIHTNVLFNRSYSLSTDPNTPEIKEKLKLVNETTASKIDKDDNKKDVKNKSFLELIKTYGPGFLAYWTVLYGVSGVSIYFAIESGLLGNHDLMVYIEKAGVGNYIDLASVSPEHVNMAIAFGVNEIAEVIRFPFTLATYPTIHKKWKSNKK